MNEATAKKYYEMYDDPEYVPETEFKPDIQVTPQIEVDKRQYTRSSNAAKKITPNTTANPVSNNVPNYFPNNQPNYNPTKISGKKFSLNGKSVGDFIRDIIYYNPTNPLDPGNYADAVAVGALASEKYARGPLEKIIVVAGVTIAGERIKNYLYEKFVK